MSDIPSPNKLDLMEWRLKHQQEQALKQQEEDPETEEMETVKP